MKLKEITHAIIGAAIEVHREVGPGLLESAYQAAMRRELELRKIPFLHEQPIPFTYKGLTLDCGYRYDLLVMDQVIVEIKSVAEIHPIHEAQLLTYLKLGGWKVGLLTNFNVAVLKDRVKRRVLNLTPEDEN